MFEHAGVDNLAYQIKHLILYDTNSNNYNLYANIKRQSLNTIFDIAKSDNGYYENFQDIYKSRKRDKIG